MTALREKTVILVTHQVEFLSEVDKILVKYLIFWCSITIYIRDLFMSNIAKHIPGNGGRKNYSIR